MTFFAFRGAKSHEWTFYDPINVDGLAKSSSTRPLKGAQIEDL